MKLLFWLALILIVILALKKKSRNYQQRIQQPAPQNEQPEPGSGDGKAETMICCQYCQVYFPVSEAVYKNKQTFCSQAHADLNQS